MFFKSLKVLKFDFLYKTTRKYSNFNHSYKKSTFIPNFNNNNRSEDLINEAFNTFKINKPEDWGDLRQYLLINGTRKSISAGNIDGTIMNSIYMQKNLDLAESYLNYLKNSDMKPNLATIGKYFRLLYEICKEDNVTKAQEAEILRIYQDLKNSYPILDSRTLEQIGLILSLTKDWRICLDIIKEIKLTSTVPGAFYSAVSSAAFLNKEEKIAWNLLCEALDEEKQISSIALLSYLKVIKRQRKKENKINSLEKLFTFLKETEIHCNEDIIDEIQSIFETGTKTAVKFSGTCSNCNEKLVKLELTNSEFSELSEIFFKNAIVGKDIFLKSNPQEMEKFQEFTKNMPKFDVVLDGLNIAYSNGTHKGSRVFAQNLYSVISHFAGQNKSVLLLGRVHMIRWPRDIWTYITKTASVFLTQNISKDDPYLLYCALKSGKDTIVVSRDLMRGHKYLLKDRKHETLYNRWLSQRQYILSYIKGNGEPVFKIPAEFSPVVQRINNIWHIPYNKTEAEEECYHKNWFCIELEKNTKKKD